jgi:hypothetical protein
MSQKAMANAVQNAKECSIFARDWHSARVRVHFTLHLLLASTALSKGFNMSDASLSASDFPQSSIIDAPSNDSDEIDSLPSEADSDDVAVSEDYSESDAEREWRESLQQLELLLSMVIVPYLGKYFGRKFAYWGKLASGRRRIEY